MTLGEGPVQHFTNAAGVQGITGLSPGEQGTKYLLDKQGVIRPTVGELAVGQTALVARLTFGYGHSTYLAENPGDIFVTEIGPEATPGQLMWIGVFADKQTYVIQFSRESALAQGVWLSPLLSARSIFGISQGTVLDDTNFVYTVTKVR